MSSGGSRLDFVGPGAVSTWRLSVDMLSSVLVFSGSEDGGRRSGAGVEVGGAVMMADQGRVSPIAGMTIRGCKIMQGGGGTEREGGGSGQDIGLIVSHCG